MIRAILGFLGSELGVYLMLGLFAAGITLTGTTLNWQNLVTVPHLERTLKQERADRVIEKGTWQAAITTAERVAKEATQRERDAETMWRGKVDAAVEDGNRRVEAAQAGRGAVERERDRLRTAYAGLAAAARLTPAGAPAPAECAPAVAAVDLQAGMLERLGGWAAELAAFADRAHAAGLVCQQAWPVNPAASAP